MTDRAIIHVDMDAFFASIEQRDNPQLRNKPIVVGGDPNHRGVVSTASYKARKYGINSAMACKRAKALCPHVIFVPVDMHKYKRVSNQIREIFTRYSDSIEPISLDEAFIDVTGKDPVAIGKGIKENIKNELNLTASVGISYNKFLAKLASDMNKPDGFTEINREEAVRILDPLPIRKLWGVGPKTEEELHKLGIFRIKDIKGFDKNLLIEKIGKRALELCDFAKGIDHRPVEWSVRSQSIGEENTFSEDIRDKAFLHKQLEIYARDIVNRIQRKHYLAKTITVKVKYEDFAIETRSLTLTTPTDQLSSIAEIAHYILDNKFKMTKKVRLLGLTVSNFTYPNEPIQLRIDLDKYMEGDQYET